MVIRIIFLLKSDINCPVRLLHGIRDNSVGRHVPFEIMDSLKTEDLEITFIKDGDHRLSKKKNLELIWNIISNLKKL